MRPIFTEPVLALICPATYSCHTFNVCRLHTDTLSMVFPGRSDAMSAAIGTILLVTITVVLVAIVTAAVMGAVGGVSDPKTVGITVEPFSDPLGNFGVLLTVTGGDDAESLKNLTIGYRDDMSFMVNGVASQHRIEDPVIGHPYILSVVGKGGLPLPDPILPSLFTVTGRFADGTEQVLYQHSIILPAQQQTGK